MIFKTPRVFLTFSAPPLASVRLGIRVIQLLFFVDAVVMADVVEAAVGAVLTTQHREAVKGDAFWGAGGVMVNGTKGEGGCCGAGRNRHHGGQDEG